MNRIDVPGGLEGLRLVQARRAGLLPSRVQLQVRQTEPAILRRMRCHQWFADPMEPIDEFIERILFESADVQVIDPPELAEQLRALGWLMTPTPPRTRTVPMGWPLVSVTAPPGEPSVALLDALQAQTYPHLEFVPNLAEARGVHVLIPTADSRPAPNLIEGLVTVLELNPESAAVVPSTRWQTPRGEVVIVPTGGPRWLAGLPLVLGDGPILVRRELAHLPAMSLLALGQRIEVHPQPLVTRRTDGDPLAIPREFPLLPLSCLTPAERLDLWSLLTARIQTDIHPLVERDRLADEEAELREKLSSWPHRWLDRLEPIFGLVPVSLRRAVRAGLRRVRGWFRRAA